jgi:hypothetical protein
LDPVIPGPKWIYVTKTGFVVARVSDNSGKEGK